MSVPTDFGPMKGRVIFSTDSAAFDDVGSEGLSFFGTRSVTITDHPAIYVHDTGGLGEPTNYRREGRSRANLHLSFVDKSRKLKCYARLTKDKTISFVTKSNLKRSSREKLLTIGNALISGDASAAFHTCLPIAATLEWEDAPPGDDESDPQTDEKTVVPIIADARFSLREMDGSKTRKLFDLPLSGFSATTQGATAVRIRARVVVKERLLVGATLYMPLVQLREDFLSALTASGGQTESRVDPASLVETGRDG